jgi:phosphate ABC transporter permease protein PstC
MKDPEESKSQAIIPRFTFFGRGKKSSDMISRAILTCIASISFLILIFVFIFLFVNSMPLFGSGYGIWNFLTGTEWNPSKGEYGVFPLLVGTLLVSLGATVLAVPLSLGCTIYLSQLASERMKKILKPAIEILAGIPSIVFGLIAMKLIADITKTFFGLPNGQVALTGSLVLAVMMIPILVSLSEDALNAVPKEIGDAAYALGLTKWESIKGVLIPSALSGISAAVILSMGRALGETMVVLMATGNFAQITFSLLDPIKALTATIALEVGETAVGGLHYSALFGVGIVLFLFTLLFNSIAGYIASRYSEA